MPEWDADLRARLAGLQLTPAREAEIIEELSQHLDDRYEELQASGASNADARRMTLEELSETGELAQRMRTLAQAHAPAPIVHGQASRHPMHGLWEDLRYLVGVIANIRQRRLPSGEFDPVVYSSYVSTPPRTMEIVARSALGPSAAAAFVGAQVRAIDADLPLMPATTVDDALTRQIWPQRLFGSMFAAFASIAMLLATCGLYGVTSYAVSRRAREIGVRVALGADTRAVWWAIAGTTLRQLAIGLALGTAGAAAIATILPAMLVGIGGANVPAFVGVAIVLIAAGLVASAVSARRALRLDPTIALQAE